MSRFFCRRFAIEPLEPRQLLSHSIGGMAFVDADGNGVRTRHELPLPSAQIYLDLNNNSLLDDGDIAAMTNRQGKFKFKRLPADIYHLREVEPSGYTAIDPGGQAMYVDLRFKRAANKQNFGYWPLVQGPPPVRMPTPITDPDPPIPLVLYNTGATVPNNSDGTNFGQLLDATGPADPYYVVEPYNSGGQPVPFATTYSSYNSARNNADLNLISASIDSEFISPTRDGLTGAPANSYLYGTAFDLTGLEPKTAEITGTVVADDRLLDVRLNGVSLGVSGVAGQTVTFATARGFVAGINTLEFLVANDTAGPTGLRVDALRGTAHKIAAGTITLFNTGVTSANAFDGSNTTALQVGALDPHWLVSTPGNGFSFYSDDTAHHFLYNNALTNGRFGAPFVASNNPQWQNDDLYTVTAGLDSTFINPVGNGTTSLLGGTYIYRTTFDLTGVDASTATLSGRVYASAPVDIYLNGNLAMTLNVGPKPNEGQDFTLSTLFVGGINSLDFVIEGDPATAPTGLRVDRLRGSVHGTGARPTGALPLELPLPAFPPIQPPTGPIPA